MLRAWLKRMDVNDLSARPHMNSPSYRDCQRRRALLAVELLENRLTPSHLTIFSATMPHGSAGPVPTRTTAHRSEARRPRR